MKAAIFKNKRRHWAWWTTGSHNQRASRCWSIFV